MQHRLEERCNAHFGLEFGNMQNIYSLATLSDPEMLYIFRLIHLYK